MVVVLLRASEPASTYFYLAKTHFVLYNTSVQLHKRRLQIERNWDKSFNRQKKEEHTKGMLGALALATPV